MSTRGGSWISLGKLSVDLNLLDSAKPVCFTNLAQCIKKLLDLQPHIITLWLYRHGMFGIHVIALYMFWCTLFIKQLACLWFKVCPCQQKSLHVHMSVQAVYTQLWCWGPVRLQLILTVVFQHVQGSNTFFKAVTTPHSSHNLLPSSL